MMFVFLGNSPQIRFPGELSSTTCPQPGFSAASKWKRDLCDTSYHIHPGQDGQRCGETVCESVARLGTVSLTCCRTVCSGSEKGNRLDSRRQKTHMGLCCTVSQFESKRTPLLNSRTPFYWSSAAFMVPLQLPLYSRCQT